MTPACPRCQSPLTGPVCAACGLRVDASPSPGTPPPGGYPPPQGGYPPPPGGPPPGGYPPQGGYSPQGGYPPNVQMGPGGVPYMMVPVPTEGPTAKWAMVGGIMGIVLSSIWLLIPLFFLAMLAGGDIPTWLPGVGEATAAMVVWALIAIFGIVAGVYSVKGRWGGALASGIFHTLIALLFLLGMIGAASDENNETGGVVIAVLIFALSAATAAFCYAGISGAKARARHRASAHAARAF